jgi:hypothetical protein
MQDLSEGGFVVPSTGRGLALDETRRRIRPAEAPKYREVE